VTLRGFDVWLGVACSRLVALTRIHYSRLMAFESLLLIAGEVEIIEGSVF